MTRIVSFIIQKGGCGKTTTTVNTASYLSRQGYRVLAVDLDPQGNLTQHFGYDSESLDLTLLDLFQDNTRFDDVVLRRSESLHILPNNLASAAEEIPLFHTISREYLLRDVLFPVKNNYDYILIDCPPNLGLFSINALAASTDFIMVISPEFFPMKAIKPLYETYKMVRQKLNHSLQFRGVLMAMCDFRTRHSQEILKILQKNFPHKLFRAYIRTNVTLKEASAYGVPIFEYDEHSAGAFDYQNFVEEFLRDDDRNIRKREYYQRRFESLPVEEQEEIMLFAQRNLSSYNQSRLDLQNNNQALQEALLIERNKIIEKLFPYRASAMVEDWKK